MLNTIKKYIKKIPNYFNYYIRNPVVKKIAPREGAVVYRDFFQDLRMLAGTESPIVVDGGGNQGGWTESILKTFKHPIIYIFEPHPDSFKVIQKKFPNQESMKIIGKALGSSTAALPLNLSDNRASSSFLKRSVRPHGSNVMTERMVEVPVVRLDDEVAKADIIKLDLEGYELEALKGADRLLRDAKIIVVEVEFEHIYEGAPLYEDIALYLRGKGFMLFNIYDTYTQRNGQLTVGDAIFIKKK